MEIKTTRELFASDVQQLCIEHNWYTVGTNDDFGRLLRSLSDRCGLPTNITDNDLFRLAQDIKEHSDTENEVSGIMFHLNRIAVTTYEIIE